MNNSCVHLLVQIVEINRPALLWSRSVFTLRYELTYVQSCQTNFSLQDVKLAFQICFLTQRHLMYVQGHSELAYREVCSYRRHFLIFNLRSTPPPAPWLWDTYLISHIYTYIFHFLH
jgi:hypothetical protein